MDLSGMPSYLDSRKVILNQTQMNATLSFMFEVRHSPNHSFQGDHDPRERGSRPLNSNR